MIEGSVTIHTEDKWKKNSNWTKSFWGAWWKILILNLGSFEVSLLSRGLKILGLRFDGISDNALIISKHLEGHKSANFQIFELLDQKVNYPELESSLDHKFAMKFLRRYSEMIAFDVSSVDKARKVIWVEEL